MIRLACALFPLREFVVERIVVPPLMFAAIVFITVHEWFEDRRDKWCAEVWIDKHGVTRYIEG
jgi:hypothetical protein